MILTWRYHWAEVILTFNFLWAGVILTWFKHWADVILTFNFLWAGVILTFRYHWAGVIITINFIWAGVILTWRYHWAGVILTFNYHWADYISAFITDYIGACFAYHILTLAKLNYACINTFYLNTGWVFKFAYDRITLNTVWVCKWACNLNALIYTKFFSARWTNVLSTVRTCYICAFRTGDFSTFRVDWADEILTEWNHWADVILTWWIHWAGVILTFNFLWAGVILTFRYHWAGVIFTFYFRWAGVILTWRIHWTDEISTFWKHWADVIRTSRPLWTEEIITWFAYYIFTLSAVTVKVISDFVPDDFSDCIEASVEFFPVLIWKRNRSRIAPTHQCEFLSFCDLAVSSVFVPDVDVINTSLSAGLWFC